MPQVQRCTKLLHIISRWMIIGEQKTEQVQLIQSFFDKLVYLWVLPRMDEVVAK